MDNKTEQAQKKISSSIVLKILIPVLIIGAIVSIYLFKNKENAAETNDSTLEINQENEVDETNETVLFALNVTEAIDLQELKSYGLPIMIDFGADSCIPCKEMAPILKKLNEELQGNAIVLFVDVWEYPDLAVDFPVRVIPTQVFIDAEGNPYVPSEQVKISLTAYTSKVTEEHYFTTHEGGLTEEMIMEIFRDMGVNDD